MTELSDDVVEQFAKLWTPRVVKEYMTTIPTAAQQIALCIQSRELLFGGAVGGGKDLACYLNIPTVCWYKNGVSYTVPVEGSIMGLESKRLEHIKVGDFVIDQDGNPIEVIWKSPIMHNKCVKVVFTDGEEIVCGEDHLWQIATEQNRNRYTRVSPEWKANRRLNRPSRAKEVSLKPGVSASISVLNRTRAEARRVDEKEPYIWDYTETITARNLQTLVNSVRNKVGIPIAGSIKFGKPWPFETDPYMYGVWLGDGSKSGGSIAQDMSDLLLLEKASGYIRRRSDKALVSHNMMTTDGVWLEHQLRRDGFLKNEKIIPNEVFASDYESRLAVLQGIVDTDGHVNDRGQLEISLTNYPLILGVQKLMISLGIRANINTREAGYSKNGVRKVTGDRYTIKCTPKIPIARYPRKLNKLQLQKNRNDMRNMFRYIDRVEDVETVPTQCIQVNDPRGLYCVGETNLVTHNSEFAIMKALQYVDVPGYSCLVLRRTWPDLNSNGAILDRFNQRMAGKSVKKKEQGRLWVFPSGAKIQFGFVSQPRMKTKFQGSEYQTIIFDEATLFEPEIYEHLLTRNRKPTIPCAICREGLTRYIRDGKVVYRHSENNKKGARTCDSPMPDPVSMALYGPAPDGTTVFDIPLQMISTSNPGGPGHLFFKERFIDKKTAESQAIDTVFIPSLLRDNPYLEKEEYIKTLEGLNIVDRERMLNGDWEINETGNMFDRGNFEFVEDPPPHHMVKSKVRFWDMAASEDKNADYTVGALCSITHDGRWWIEDIVRGRWNPAKAEQIIKNTAAKDGIDVRIWMEQEPGSAGKTVISHFKRIVLAGYRFDGYRSTGPKTARAGALASQVGVRNVMVVQDPTWNKDLLDEMSVFPTGLHDDQVDACSGAFIVQTSMKKPVRIIV